MRKPVRKPFILLLVVVLVMSLRPSVGSADGNRGGLPLGPPDLREKRETQPLAPGVTYTRIVRGQPSEKDLFTVDVAFHATREEAEREAARLRSDGHRPRVKPIRERAPDDPREGPLGYLVRVGAFSDESEAEELKQELTAQGYSGLRVVYTGEDGGPTTGPWVVHVLEIDPRSFKGNLVPQLGKDRIQGRETLSSMVGRTGALAGVNGGYFVVGETDGTPGDLAGTSVINGRVLSEAVRGRTSLVLPSDSGQGARVAPVSTELEVLAANGVRRELDGLNRRPGLIRGCGGSGGDRPTEEPKHDYTCTDDSELIRFTSAFGDQTPGGEGTEAVLDASGRVLEIRTDRGGPIPEKGSVLAATGEARGWLQQYARPGTRLTFETRVQAGRHRLPLSPRMHILNGGPRLLKDGEPAITAVREGFHWKENPEFYYRFGARRNPRTLAGITEQGRLLLVTVDGRNPGTSIGASFKESARILKALGAREGLNLDGGGSTTMTVEDRVVNHPSDPTGERPIADALLIRE
ncbi:sporulation related protein [Melghirimyces profundicolus]|uniref:Sporulation related protein n=1 Tax=Melghirimyces profundicolus TaxID=1242148 RepID=A0A2T6C7R6_9BACL|nr:phosphodiester glycosidase family protein [Melghirimyces profundicolus]PTX64369.1 sporulation related protein [Melghirimyces profundicolus]